MDEKNLARVHGGLPQLVAELKAGAIDRREFLRLTTLVGLSAGAAYALAGKITGEHFVPQASAATPKKGGDVRVSMRVLDLKNPRSYSWVFAANIGRQVLEYLTKTGHDNVTRPYLLEGWSASDDLKTWTLKIRKGVKWNNGEELVADHVIWNISRWLDESVGSSVLGLMKGYMLEEYETGEKNDKGEAVKSTRLWADNAIEKADDHTVVLNCKSPQVAIPEHLFHYPASIMHPSSEGVFEPGAIGTGPFTLEEVEVGKKAVLKARSDYWGDGPFLDSVTVIDHGDDAAAGMNAMISKQADLMHEASTTQYAALNAQPHLNLYQVSTAQTAGARMKVGSKAFSDPRVRKAMRLAIDTDKVLKVSHLGLGSAAEHHHVCPIQPDYFKLDFMKQDIPAAKALLAEAGFPDGFDTEIACQKDPAWELLSVQAMVEMWKQIGVNVKINVMPGAQYWENWKKVDFGYTRWTHRPLAVMLLPLAYRSGVPWNESDFANEKFDDLLGKAEGTLDIKERQMIMKQMQEIMQEEGPIIQAVWRAVFTFADKRLNGFSMHPTSYMFMNDWWVA